jgi:hypothetical protein
MIVMTRLQSLTPHAHENVGTIMLYVRAMPSWYHGHGCMWMPQSSAGFATETVVKQKQQHEELHCHYICVLLAFVCVAAWR